jgi:hypothetical protein
MYELLVFRPSDQAIQVHLACVSAAGFRSNNNFRSAVICAQVLRSRLSALPDILATGARHRVRRLLLSHGLAANGTSSMPHDSTPQARFLRSHRGPQIFLSNSSSGRNSRHEHCRPRANSFVLQVVGFEEDTVH